jgi:transcriptional regulator with XRE-family HTH domain
MSVSDQVSFKVIGLSSGNVNKVDNSLGERIRELRRSLGLKQHQFGTLLGITQRSVARYEGGQRPSDHVLARLGELAARANHSDLAQTFWSNTKHPQHLFRNPVERTFVALFVTVLQNRQVVPEINWDSLVDVLLRTAREICSFAETNNVPLDPSTPQFEKQVFEAEEALSMQRAIDRLTAKISVLPQPISAAFDDLKVAVTNLWDVAPGDTTSLVSDLDLLVHHAGGPFTNDDLRYIDRALLSLDVRLSRYADAFAVWQRVKSDLYGRFGLDLL